MDSNLPTMYMTVGLAASGKTTYAYDLAKNMNANESGMGRTTNVFDSDELRGEMFGDECHQGDNGKLFAELQRRVKRCLENGDNAIYCATNLSSKRRRAFLNGMSKIKCNKVCLIIATPFEQCVLNNVSREREVPYHAMNKMYKSFQTPAMFEGWDEIDIVYWKGSKGSVGAFDCVCNLIDFDQDNGHHTLSLGNHMIEAYKHISERDFKDVDVVNLRCATLLHDIGKEKCKTYLNTKGIKCNNAHYYGHENVGAYDVLFFDVYDAQTDDDIMLISLLINLHMSFYHFDRSENSQKIHNKYKKLWGDELYNMVEELHIADISAH